MQKAGGTALRRAALVLAVCLFAGAQLHGPPEVAASEEPPGGALRLAVADLRFLYSRPADISPWTLAGIAGLTYALVLADQELYGEGRALAGTGWDGVVQIGRVVGEAPFWATAAYLATRHDPALRQVTVDALLLTGLHTMAGKILLGMARPSVDGRPRFVGPTLDSRFHALPSGHTSVAFALATVFSDAYPQYRWPLYAAAVAVALSRVADEHHWVSNVVLGAAVGHLSARHVLRHREELLTFRF